jgi:hypothetical protein
LVLERVSEAVESRVPQTAVLCEPLVELAEWLRLERVETPLSIRPHRDEACFVKDAQVTGDTGLVDPCLLNDVVDLPLACPQRFDNSSACRVGEGLEGI